MSGERVPVRLLMLNYEFPPVGGGAGVACEHLVRVFGEMPEVRLDLVTSGIEPRSTVERLEPNVVVHRLPVGKRDRHYWRGIELARWTWGALRLAKRLAREEAYDVCHCWAGWPPGLIGYLLRRRLPYLVSLRGSDVPGYSARLSLLDPLVFRRVSGRVWGEASAVVAVSDELRNLALRTRSDLDIRVIPNAADTETFHPGKPDERFTVLFVGRLIPRKGVGDLLAAFEQVLSRLPGARLIVAGDGPEGPSLRADARARGLQGAVTFMGRVPRDELPAIYRSASVFALPSAREGMPNVLLEAMASGLPVVVTEGSSGVLDGNGTVVEAGDVASLANALVRYASDAALRSVHGRRSRELAESRSWDAVGRWYLELYQEMLRRSTPLAPTG